jgi:hypothetical protein
MQQQDDENGDMVDNASMDVVAEDDTNPIEAAYGNVGSVDKVAPAETGISKYLDILNAYEDHLLLSSAKSINLNSQESVNIDTRKFITQADKIFLGKEDLATEPLLLGDTTVNLLRDLISALKSLSNASITNLSDFVSRALVASSNTRSLGLVKSARAIPIR